jgi:hypothetical protein
MVTCPVVRWRSGLYVVITGVMLHSGRQSIEVVEVTNEPWVRKYQGAPSLPDVQLEAICGTKAVFHGYDRILHQLPIIDIGVQVTPQELWEDDAGGPMRREPEDSMPRSAAEKEATMPWDENENRALHHAVKDIMALLELFLRQDLTERQELALRSDLRWAITRYRENLWGFLRKSMWEFFDDSPVPPRLLGCPVAPRPTGGAQGGRRRPLRLRPLPVLLGSPEDQKCLRDLSRLLSQHIHPAVPRRCRGTLRPVSPPLESRQAREDRNLEGRQVLNLRGPRQAAESGA